MLSDLERECVQAQARLVAGDLDASYGTTELIEGDAGAKAERFANYVLRITDPLAGGSGHHPVAGGHRGDRGHPRRGLLVRR